MFSHRLIWCRSRWTRSPRQFCSTLTPWRKVSEPSQVIPMSAARRFPSLSMRSCWVMGCGVTASCRCRCTAGRFRLFSTSPVRSPITRSRALLSLSSWLQTDLILSLSRVIRPSSLCNFWTRRIHWCPTGSENNLRLFAIGHRILLPPLSCSFSLCFPSASLRGRLHSRAERERE